MNKHPSRPRLAALATLLLGGLLLSPTQAQSMNPKLGEGFAIPRLHEPLPVDDWSALAELFAPSPVITFGQPWQEESDENFRPTEVRLLWQPEALWVFAILGDGDIFNRAKANNERTWEMGDVFELFLSEISNERYLELHVTPNNITLQLEWPDYGAIYLVREASASTEDYLVTEPIFKSWVNVRAEDEWLVLARISAETITGDQTFRSDVALKCSFSRYDAFSDDLPIIFSASSPHKELNYHLQSDWGVFTLDTSR